MGTPDFAVPTLEALFQSEHRVLAVVTQPDRPRGRGRKPLPPPVKAAGLAAGVPVLQPADVNSAAALDSFRRLAPDLIVVIAFGQLLGPELLDLPGHGCINVHASLLPKYRGASPISAAILAGESETGVSVMRVIKELDAGDVLAQAATAIGPRMTAGELHDRLAELSAQALVATVDTLARGDAVARPQDHGLATYAPKLSKADGSVDWQQPAEYLDRLVRAVTPWPGAAAGLVTASGDKPTRVRLLDVCVAPRGGAGAPGPGTVLRVTDDGIDVATGTGALRITRLQRAGRRPLSAAEFTRGRPVHPGDRFVSLVE